MAKESLTKSTAKKKAATTKKKKAAAAKPSASAKKAPAKKTTKASAAAKPKKKAPAAKTKKAATTKPAAKTKKAATTKAKKTTAAAPRKKAAAAKTAKKSTKTTKASPAVKKKAAPKKAVAKKRTPAKAAKKVSVQDLLKKKFETTAPATLYEPPSDLILSSQPTAPPFVSQGDAAEAKRIKELLFKKFTLTPEADSAAADTEVFEADAAPTQTAPVEPPPPPMMEEIQSDPLGKPLKFAAIGLLVIVLLVLNASRSNTQRFYIASVEGAVEIWQGKFMPIGKEKILILPGTQAPATPKAVYAKNEAYLLAYNHYLEAADALLEAPGMPDFEGIKSFLNQALAYVVTKPQRAEITNRLSNIDTMVLLYKADVAAAKNTPQAMKEALAYLKEAAGVNTNPHRAEQIKLKITSTQKQMAALKAKAPVPAPKPVGTE